MSHSCHANCASQVVIVDGKYTIMLRALQDIAVGEELTQNYGASTDSEWEYRKAICLCGCGNCHGSFLQFNRHEAFLQVAKAEHTPLHRAARLAYASTASASTSAHDSALFKTYHFGECVLGPLPPWLRKWAALMLGFVELEQRLLPDVLHTKGDLGIPEAKLSALGMVDKRVMAVVMNIDAARASAASTSATALSAPPLLRRLDSDEMAALLWSGPRSLARRALECIRRSCSIRRPKWYSLQTRFAPQSTVETYYINVLTEETSWTKPADANELVPQPPKGFVVLEQVRCSRRLRQLVRRARLPASASPFTFQCSSQC